MAKPTDAVDPASAAGVDRSSSRQPQESHPRPQQQRARPPPPLKQKMALSLKSLVSSAQRFVLGDSSDGTANTTPSDPAALFPVTTPAADGDDCDHDCESCHVKYPRDFKIDEADQLYGHVKGWSTHVLVATGKSDWVRDVADEKGSVMEALDKAAKPTNGRMMLSASNIPTPHGTSDYSEPTTIVLLPAFAVIHNVTPATALSLVDNFINIASTSTTPLSQPLSIPRSIPSPADPTVAQLTATPSPHNVLILLCSQKTRDARCGQSAPLLKRELERHLRPLGLYRDYDDQRPGGVGVYFISHVGGHKYSANMMVYRRPNAYGVDDVDRAKVEAEGGVFKIDPKAGQKPRTSASTVQNGHGATGPVADGHAASPESNGHVTSSETSTETSEAKQPQQEALDPDKFITDEGAGQCIWLARIKPEDCENIVRYTVLQGRVVKPDTQLRGGFDRGKSLISW